MRRTLPAGDGALTAKALFAETNETTLIGRVAEGDRRAFETLYRCYFPRLVRFLDRMVRNTQAIEEIVNDTMLVVWQKAGSFDRTSKVSTWIFAIAYRKALQAIRGRDEPVEFDPDLLPDEDRDGPEDALLRREQAHSVGQALEKLPLEQRVAICLAYYHAMGQTEIAGVMECPVNTVKSRIFHARNRLKSLLAAESPKEKS